MAEVISDSDVVDFEGFEDVVDRVLLRKASSYLEQMQAEFAPKQGRGIEMFSTKLRGCIEFRPGEVTIWAGYNGHRKSMFTGQMVLDLITQKRRVMVASFEMQPSRTLARMARQASSQQVPSNVELERFATWTDGKLWIFDHMGRVQPSKVLAMCRFFAMEKMGHHVVIDSMMMVCRSEESLDEQKQFMTDLVRLAQETGLHVHLVAHCRKPQNGEERPPSKYDLRGSAALSDQAANVITIWANKAKKAKADEPGAPVPNEPDAIVEVCKQRNGQWEGKVKLWFDELSLRFVDDSVSRVEPYAQEAYVRA